MMIDLPPVNSQYEYVVDDSYHDFEKEPLLGLKGKTSLQENFFFHDDVKAQTFRVMAGLEGWCSKEKASVMMDFIFLLKPQKIVEIGVFGGKSFIPMAFALRANNTGGIVYGIDPWSSLESGKGMEGVNYEWWTHVDHNRILAGLERSIAENKLGEYTQLIRSTSEEAPLIEDIEMLHIDGNHSDATSYIDVTKWVPLVRSGGLIVFDDINWSTTSRVIEWLDANCVKIVEYRGDNIWGIWVKP